MNKIYRVVWNKSTQTWTAVSEYATAQGKSSSRSAVTGSEVKSTKGIRFIYTALASATLMLVSGQAWAVTGNGSTTGDSKYCFYDATSQSVVCGDATTSTVDTVDGKKPKAVVMGIGATNAGESSIAIGATASSAGTASVAMGNAAKAGANQAVALGQNAQANGQWDISIGRQAGWGAKAPKATEPKGNEGRNIAFGDGALKNGLDVNNNTALGTSAGENLVGSHNIIMGSYSNTENAIASAVAAGSTEQQIGVKTREVDTVDNKKRQVKYIESNNSVAIGHRALATGAAGVAVGQQAKAFDATTVAVGNGTRATGNNAVAMGNTANAGAAGAIAIGQHANYDNVTSGLQNAQKYKTTGANSIAIGVRAHSEATRSIVMGAESSAKAITPLKNKVTSKKHGEFAVDIVGATTAVGSVAIGPESIVNGTNAVSIGQASEALGQNTFAGGNDSHAIGKSSVAIGDGALSENDASVAVGYTSKALGASSTALGSQAQAKPDKSVAVGFNARAVGSETSSISIGEDAYSDASGALVIGKRATAKGIDGGTFKPYNAIAIGSEANVDTIVATGGATQERSTDAIAIGTKAKANYASTIAIGYEAKANTKSNATAIGYRADAQGWESVAVGPRTLADAKSSGAVVIGRDAKAYESNSLALGNKATVVEKGILNQDGTGERSSYGAIAVGDSSSVAGANSIAVGKLSKTTFINSTAVGAEAHAVGYNTSAFGYQAVAKGTSSIAIGDKALAGSHTAGSDSVPHTNRAIAIGVNTNATGETAIALGSNSESKAHRGTALGVLSQVKQNDGVALGAYSSANRAAGLAGSDILGAKDPNADAHVWTATHAAISVGNDTANPASPRQGNSATEGTFNVPLVTRQITGVAAGTNDTDAVNVAQLKAAGFKLTTSESGTGKAYGTTEEKVKNGDTVIIDAGDNIKITQAQNKITVATKKDVVFDSVTTGDSVLNGSGLTINNGTNPSLGITKAGISAGGKIITNVKKGVGGTDAVNKDQLEEAIRAAGTINQTLISNNTPFSYVNGSGEQLIREVNAQTGAVTFKKAAAPNDVYNGTDITIAALNPTSASQAVAPTRVGNVANGVKDHDAVNVEQLKGVVNALGGNAAIDSTIGSFTAPSYTITKTDDTTYPVANSVGDALSNLNAEVVKPITFSGDTGTAFERKLGQTTTIKGGVTDENKLSNSNIGVVAKDGTLDIKLAKDITIDSVTTGDVQVNNEGLSIISGPSITKSNGINAGNKVIADVASNLPTTQNNTAAQGAPSNATKVQATPTDADAIKNNAATVGDVLNAGWNVQTNGDATDFVRAYDTVNFADGVGTTITSETDGSKTTFKVNVNAQSLAESTQLPVVYTDADGNKLYLVEKNDPNTPGTKIKVFNTKPDGAGNDVDPPNVIASMQNAVGQTTYPMTLTNVAAGKKINDAVNVGQLPFAYVNNRQEILTRTVDENGNVVFYKSDGTLYQGIDISISALHPTNGQQVARATKIGNVDKGVYGTDAVNVSQLGDAGIYETTQNGDIVLENGAPKLKGLNFAGNDGKGNTKLGDTWSIVGGNAGANPTDPRTFTDGAFSGGNIKTVVKDGVVEITMADSPKFGDIVINNQGKITGVANGDITATSKDAINGSQLYAVSTAIKNLMGGNANVDDAGNVTASDIGGTGQSNIHDAIKTVKTTVKSTDNSIKVTANPADAINGTVFDISVNAQGLAESAQLPVVYTKKDGTKVYKVGDKFFDNKEGTGTEIEATNIIASMQNADGTITPTTLANIKAGTKDTDAVNVSQLKGVADTLGGGASINADGTINAPTYNITNPADGAVIKAQNVGDALNALNTAVNNPLTFAGDTGLFNRNLGQTTTIKGGVIDENKLSNSNIGVVAKDGTLDIKLAKDITIDSVTTGNTTVNNDGITIKAPVNGNTADVKLTANGLNNGGNKITNVAEGTVDTDAVNFAQLKEVQKTAKAAKTEVQAGNNMAVTYSTGADGQTIYTVATKDDVSFNKVTAGTGTNQVILDNTGVNFGGNTYISDAGLNANNKKVTNVADGAITATSKDAINGSQLYAVSTATKNLMGGNATVNTDGTVTASNIGGTGQSNIHDAIASINTIANTGWNVQTNGGDKINVKPSDTVNFIDGSNIKITNDGTNITVATADNLNVASVTAGNTLVNNTGVKVGDVHVTADGINAGNQQITNLKSGLNGKTIDDIKADPSATERSNAATIGDLATVQSNVTNISNNVTNITNNVLGGNYVDSDGELTASGKLALKTYDVSGQEGTTDNTIISAIKNMNEGGIKYFHTNDGTNKPAGSKDNNNEDSNASGAYATAVGFRANAEGENALAFGKGSQALAKNAIAIGTGNIVTGENSGAIGDPSIINGANSYSVGNNNTVATDKTFVLGNEVKQTVANSVFLGDASSSTGVHTTANGGHYTYAGANDANVSGVSGSTAPVGVVSVGTEGGQTRQVQNVAAGVVSANSTDAINGSQLYDTHQAIGQLANQTVNLGNQLNNRIGDVEDKANAGVSSAMAMASLPQAYIPGKSMLTGGLATYNGEGAVAVGLSKLSDNGRWVLKMSGSADTKGNAGASIGAGFHF